MLTAEQYHPPPDCYVPVLSRYAMTVNGAGKLIRAIMGNTEIYVYFRIICERHVSSLESPPALKLQLFQRTKMHVPTCR